MICGTSPLRVFSFLSMLLLALLGNRAPVQAAPANDDFANAVTISGSSGSLSATNVGSTKEAGEPAQTGDSSTVWYRWTAPQSGGATFTVVADFEDHISVWTGSQVDNLTPIVDASDFDEDGKDIATVTFHAEAGIAYSIAVGGAFEPGDTEQGNFNLTWSSGPANDDYANAQIVEGRSIAVSGTDVGASREAGESDITRYASIWYRWTAPTSGNATFTTRGSDFNNHLSVWTGSKVSSLTWVADAGDNADPEHAATVTFYANAGTTYSIAVGSDAEPGNVVLYGGQAPANDDFANAQIIFGSSGIATGINLPASLEPGEPPIAGVTGGASVWYRWTAPSTGKITFSTTGSDFDTLLAVYTGSDLTHLTVVAANDNYPSSPLGTSLVTFEATVGTTYSIALDGVDGATGHTVLRWFPPRIGDFNGDGQADIVFQNPTTGQLAVWYMQGNYLLGGAYLYPAQDPHWKAVALADFNGDGQSDILFQNPTTGQLAVWYLDGIYQDYGAFIYPAQDPKWSVVGCADLNGDGQADIVFQNPTTGQLAVWYMNNNYLLGGAYIYPAQDPHWKAVALADFNGDGQSDILFQNPTTGQLAVWYMQGNYLLGGAYLYTSQDPKWKALGSG